MYIYDYVKLLLGVFGTVPYGRNSVLTSWWELLFEEFGGNLLRGNHGYKQVKLHNVGQYSTIHLLIRDLGTQYKFVQWLGFIFVLKILV
jgi:hypothetical protein